MVCLIKSVLPSPCVSKFGKSYITESNCFLSWYDKAIKESLESSKSFWSERTFIEEISRGYIPPLLHAKISAVSKTFWKRLKAFQKSIPRINLWDMVGIMYNFIIFVLFLNVMLVLIYPKTFWQLPSAVLTNDLHSTKFGNLVKSFWAKSPPIQLTLAPVSNSPYSL